MSNKISLSLTDHIIPEILSITNVISFDHLPHPHPILKYNGANSACVMGRLLDKADVFQCPKLSPDMYDDIDYFYLLK